MQSLNFVLEKKRKPQLPSRFPWFVRFTGREFKTSTLYLLLHSSLCSTFALSVFFFSCPSLPPETAGIQLSVCVDCTSHHAVTHTYTQAHTGCLPHHPSQTDTGPAWHLNSTEGTALGSINMHDSIIGYAQTRTCTFTHVCAFCIHVQEVLMHTRTAQCIQTCSHTHTHSYSHY